MRLTSESIALASARGPWWVVGAWLVALAISIGLSAALLGDALTTDFDFTDDPESKRAAALRDSLRGETITTEIVLVRADEATVADDVFADYVLALQNELNDLGGEIITVGSFFTFTGPVSDDRQTVLLPVVVAGDDFAVMAEVSDRVHDVIEAMPAPAGFSVLVAGPGTLNNDFNHLAEETLQRGELIGVLIALVILVAVFGAVVAAVLPIIVALAAIAVTLGVAAVVGQVLELSFFITPMVTMIGLAVGIDYSLFVVSRYREERLRGHEEVGAITVAAATASRAVFFSGIIVVLALSAMLLVPSTLFQSLAIGAIVVVIIAVIAALTLLPAAISVMGDHLERGRIRKLDRDPDREGSVWDRIAGAMMRRPWVSLIGSVGVLLFLASFYLRIDTGFSGVETMPVGTPSRVASEAIAEDFPAGLSSPVEITIVGEITPEVEAATAQLRATVADDPAFAESALAVSDAGDVTLVSAPLTSDFQSKQSADAVVKLRTETIPSIFEGIDVEVLVGGYTALNVDFVEDAEQAQPVIVLWVLGLSFVLLLLVFRSIVIPTTSILMNLLSVGAAYGLVVLLFQEGAGPDVFRDIGSLLGFEQLATVESWLPLMLFSVLFGLSMDYHIFLLSRIKEHHDHHGDNDAAVRHGLRTTASLITGAALIMVAVFGGFAAGELAAFQQLGFGLAVAVLIDATIIRSVIVPATMKILGEWNWYLPSWLRWLPTLRIEGERRPPLPAAPTAETTDEAAT